MLCRLVVLAAAAAAFAPAGLTARTSVAMSATMSKAKLTTMVKGLTKETFESIYEQEAWIVENGGKTWIKKTLKRVDEKAKAFGLTVKPDFLAKEKRTTEEVEAAEVLGEERAAPTAAAWRAACDAEGVTSYADFGITLAASRPPRGARAAGGPADGRPAWRACDAEGVASYADFGITLAAAGVVSKAPEAPAAESEVAAAEAAEAAAAAEAKAAADLAAERAAEQERLAAKAAAEKAASEGGSGAAAGVPRQGEEASLRAEGQRPGKSGGEGASWTTRRLKP
ncbi:hypothetical protein SO694_00078042 [Aureococcus anophagefferens]|uniref:Uncharacterized protein n=1 Tax=Aureococcus anophagefferens TaxID=44056 RepID=A0ABR1FH15_AURAN